jgi:hypothetical protein
MGLGTTTRERETRMKARMIMTTTSLNWKLILLKS